MLNISTMYMYSVYLQIHVFEYDSDIFVNINDDKDYFLKQVFKIQFKILKKN